MQKFKTNLRKQVSLISNIEAVDGNAWKEIQAYIFQNFYLTCIQEVFVVFCRSPNANFLILKKLI